jgi:hypothetical protein
MSNIKLSNDSNEPLSIFLEPEGSMFEIPVNEYIEISLTEGTLPLEFVYSEYLGKNTLSIWPNKGFPRVIYKNRNLLE